MKVYHSEYMQELSPEAIQSEDQKRTRGGIFIIFGIIAFFGIGLGGVLLGKYLYGPKTLQPELIVTPTPRGGVPIVTTTPNPIENWKTYTNISGGFSFKYPSNYFQFQQEDRSRIYLAPSAGKGGNGTKFLNQDDVWLDVGILAGVYSFSSVDVYLQSGSQIYSDVQKIPISVDGISGVTVKYSLFVAAGDVRQYSQEALVLNDGKIYSIILSSWNQTILQQHEEMFDQILSTFKFLEP